MTELFNIGLTCCRWQKMHQRRVFTVMGSMSGSGLSMNVICGYCGLKDTVDIAYPDFITHLSDKDKLEWRNN